MGKKRRIKKNNEQKQGHKLGEYDKPRNTSRDLDLDMDDFISNLRNNILEQIFPLLLHKRKHQEEHDPDNITTMIANNIMDPNDFISRLPNNILYQIISMLPFESALKTTFLSTHWNHLWEEALLASVRVVTIQDAFEAISTFLDDFNTQHRPRNKWGLKFEFGPGTILSAAIAPNSTLKLDFTVSKQEEQPYYFYAIRPFNWSLKLNRSSYNSWWHRSPPYYFGLFPEEIHPMYTQPITSTFKVKSLYLISLTYPCIEAVSSMVSNFGFLQSLTITKCNGLRALQIKEARGLQKLVVLDCLLLESLYFSGSCLTSFRYRGRLISFEFHSPNNEFHLNDAMLDFRKGPPIYNIINCDDLKSMLESIKGVKSLTLCRWIFEALISYMLPSLGSDLEYHLCGLREVWWIDCSMDRDNVHSLLSFLKLCRFLERLYVTIDPESYNFRSTKKFAAKLNSRHEKFDDLKLLKLEGFASENMEIFLVKWLKPLFRETPLILAKTNDRACLRRLVKAPKLGKERKYPYKFKEVRSFHEKHPDHLHMKL